MVASKAKTMAVATKMRKWQVVVYRCWSFYDLQVYTDVELLGQKRRCSASTLPLLLGGYSARIFVLDEEADW